MKIGIVDDHVIFRDGIRQILKSKDFIITLEAQNGVDMVEKLSVLPKSKIPEIMIVDINMPVMDGFETVKWLKKNNKDIKIVILSMKQDEESIIRMLKLGVNCYFTKIVDQVELLKALKTIRSDGQYFTKEVTNVLVENLKGENNPAKVSKVHLLTENEIKFIKFACSDLTYAQIADEMGISPRTIDGYREVVFSKLDLKTRVALALFAVKNNLVKL